MSTASAASAVTTEQPVAMALAGMLGARAVAGSWGGDAPTVAFDRAHALGAAARSICTKHCLQLPSCPPRGRKRPSA
jgi:hypothetical protein